MTEQEQQARIAAGCLWEDTDEYLAHQGVFLKSLKRIFGASSRIR